MSPYQQVLRVVGAKRDPKRAATNWERTHPQAMEAHLLVGQAIRLGWVVRKPCEVCGGNGEAHHDDYDHPLALRWLCRKHHRRHHIQERSA